MDKNSRIFIAGHRGLVGSALVRRLQAEGYSHIITRAHGELDLEHRTAVETFFATERPEYIFLAAARVGGIHANSTYPVEFLLNNLKIQNNIIEASAKYEASGLLFLGSSCIYPRMAPQPLKEELLLSGYLEPTNEPYALAKIAGIVLCESFNREYGKRFLSVMPTNLYGPNDSFHMENSHVLPALIRKFHLARLASLGDWKGIEADRSCHGAIPPDFLACLAAIARRNGHSAPTAIDSTGVEPAVILWGSGKPRREFLHSDDLADACLFLVQRLDRLFETLSALPAAPNASMGSRHLINIGYGEDLTIRDLASLTAGIVGFDGAVAWDSSRPDGTPKKLLDVNRLTELGWKPKIPLREGIRGVYEDYCGKVSMGA